MSQPALPVIDHEGRPQGLINRRVFNERMAVPFARELLGRKPCIQPMHASPIMADVAQSIDAMSGDPGWRRPAPPSDGFIITRDGRYAGVGTGEALVRRVTELRIEAVCYANPDAAAGQHPDRRAIARLIEARQSFMAAYCDLNHFKPQRPVRLMAATA